MALVVQISTYEELKKIIAESGKEYDREQIEAAGSKRRTGWRKRSTGSRSGAPGSPISFTRFPWQPSWWGLAWIPNR